MKNALDALQIALQTDGLNYVVVIVGKRTRRIIRQTCLDKGCDLDEYIYFRNNRKEIFVTKQLNAGEYLLITAFKI